VVYWLVARRNAIVVVVRKMMVFGLPNAEPKEKKGIRVGVQSKLLGRTIISFIFLTTSAGLAACLSEACLTPTIIGSGTRVL
jgi:hypothetical protein